MDYKFISVRVSHDLHKQLKTISASHETTVTNVITKIVEKWIAEQRCGKKIGPQKSV